MAFWRVRTGMTRDVKLNQIERVLSELDYPLDPNDVAEECDDVQLILADGEENLGALIRGSSADRFESMDDLKSEVMNLLPRHAVGEPYQSEGDA